MCMIVYTPLCHLSTLAQREFDKLYHKLTGLLILQDKLREREREMRKRKEREEQELEKVRAKVRKREAVTAYQALLMEKIKDPEVKACFIHLQCLHRSRVI